MFCNLKKKKTIFWLITPVVILLFLYFGWTYQLTSYVEVPGNTYNISEYVEVEGTKDEITDGQYDFVTVLSTPLTPFLWLFSQMSPNAEIISAEDNFQGLAEEEYDWVSELFMVSSQNEAVNQAMLLAGEDVSFEFKGVYILRVSDNSTFKDVLKIGDTVTAVNGTTFNNSKDFIDYLNSMNVGASVSITYERDGKEKVAEGKIIKLQNGKSGLGISLVDHAEVKSDNGVDFVVDGIGGPSAGLMFSLYIYDRLIDEDLLKGRYIAGTGTIENDGSVGEISGIDKKVVAADKAGVEIFLVPDYDLTDEEKKQKSDVTTNKEVALKKAKEIGTDMKIVPVKTLEDAVKYLRK